MVRPMAGFGLPVVCFGVHVHSGDMLLVGFGVNVACFGVPVGCLGVLLEAFWAHVLQTRMDWVAFRVAVSNLSKKPIYMDVSLN